MSPNPSRATKIEERASGMEVPTAMTTKPMVKWLISSISPINSTHSNIPNEINTIHTIAIVNDNRYHLRVSGVSHLGMVSVYNTYSGNDRMNKH